TESAERTQGFGRTLATNIQKSSPLGLRRRLHRGMRGNALRLRRCFREGERLFERRLTMPTQAELRAALRRLLTMPRDTAPVSCEAGMLCAFEPIAAMLGGFLGMLGRREVPAPVELIRAHYVWLIQDKECRSIEWAVRLASGELYDVLDVATDNDELSSED